MIAALYVDPNGIYPSLLGPELCWSEARDARFYDGPHPVVAHPPCARWCRLAKLVASLGGLAVGDDGGTFSAALAAVRRFGGVLEHPAFSMAWPAHGLPIPPRTGWQQDMSGGWVCEVAQSAYGHRATKLTWLYYVGNSPPPSLDWRKPRGRGVVSGMRNRCGRALTERVWPKEASATTPEFAAVLLGLAEAAQ